jgi:hypothetical protein
MFVTIFDAPTTTGDVDTLFHVAPAEREVDEYKT